MARCCSRCFRDPVLIDVLQSNGDRGNCDFCKATDAASADVALLAHHFQELLSLYEAEEERETTPSAEPPSIADGLLQKLNRRFGRSLQLIPNPILPIGLMGDFEGSKPLREILDNNWAIFSGAISAHAKQMLTESIVEAAGLPSEQAKQNWTWAPRQDLVLKKAYSQSWAAFSNHLKSERRFRPDIRSNSVEDMRALFGRSLGLVEVRESDVTALRARGNFVNETPRFYRSEEPLPKSEMGAPPQSQTTEGGRLNPPGIPFLYLANDEVTAVAEIRAAKNDLVSVAVFTTSKDLRIADLTSVQPMETAFGHEDLVNEFEIRRLLRDLGRELAQPVNTESSPIEYVPTQFFAEVVRDAGFDGIRYPSALGPASNLVLFDPAVAESQEPYLVRVTDIQYSVAPEFRGLF